MKTRYILSLALIFMVVLSACTPKGTNVLMPEGPAGPTGPVGKSAYEVWREALLNGEIAQWDTTHNDLANYAKYLLANRTTTGGNGKNGESAYEMWKRMVTAGEVDNPFTPNQKWSAQETQISDFWRFLTGAKGEQGGIPRIENGYWFVGNTPTGIKAQGDKGKQGAPAQPPVLDVDANGNWTVNNVVLTDAKTGFPVQAQAPAGANGANGTSPTLSVDTNGNWVITYPDGRRTETKTKAKGKNGNDVVITIDPTSHHWIIKHGEEVTDTNISAFGERGDKGEPGTSGDDVKSVYQLWKEDVEKGIMPNHHEKTGLWDSTKSTISDFWFYISTYRPKDEEKIEIPYTIVPIAMLPIQNKNPEYVSRKTGKATYRVLKNGVPVGAGYKVKNIPFLSDDWATTEPQSTNNYEFTTDANGEFTIDNKNLPLYSFFGVQKPPAGYPSYVTDIVITQPTTFDRTKVPEGKNIYVVPTIEEPGGTEVQPRPMLLVYRVTLKVLIERDLYTSADADYPSISFQVRIQRERGVRNFIRDPQLMEDGDNTYQDKFEVYVLNNPDELNSLENTEVKHILAYNGVIPKGEFKGRAYVRRPYILDEDEKSVRGTQIANLQDFARNVYQYKWDTDTQQANYYVTVATQEQYGRKWMAMQKVLIPPVNTAPKFEESKVYYDEAQKVLFGTIDKASVKEYYYTNAYWGTTKISDTSVFLFPVKDSSTNQDPNSVRWEPDKKSYTDTKKPLTGIPNYTRLAFTIKNENGDMHTAYSLPLKEGSKEQLHFVIPNVEAGSHIAIRPDLNGKDTKLWRGRDTYVFTSDNNGGYELLSPLHTDGDTKDDHKLDVQKATFESDWLTSSKSTPTTIQQP